MSCFRCVMGGYRKCEQQRLPLNEITCIYLYCIYFVSVILYLLQCVMIFYLQNVCVCVFVNGGWSFTGLIVDPVSDCSMESVHRYVGYSWP